jgi:hypothetical protein
MFGIRRREFMTLFGSAVLPLADQRAPPPREKHGKPRAASVEVNAFRRQES